MSPHAAGLRLPRPRPRSLAAMIALPLALAACDAEQSLAPEVQESAPASVAADVTPGLAATPQRIVYAIYRNGQYDISRINATGQSPVALTNNTVHEMAPAWSWDNKRVALGRLRTNASSYTRPDIYIMNADGTNGHWARTQTCDCDLINPSWSPDGSRLVVTMLYKGTYYVAYLILGTGQLSAFSTGYGGLPGTAARYTKSGQIVYLGPTNTTVFRMSGTGTNIKAIFTAPTGIAMPALSPDGTKLAFARLIDADNNWDIFLRNLTTGKTITIASSPASDRDPSWSPDGSRIAFVSGRADNVSQIYTVTPTGGTVTRISYSGKPEAMPAWSH